MKPREVLLTSDETMGNSFTKTLPIDIDSLISGLYVQFRATNGGTSNVASPASHVITKIELVDGGSTFWTMPGLLQRGMNAHLQGVTPHSKISEIGGDSQYDNIPIFFGRKLYDEQYAFNPKAFNNPQLKVTGNLAAVNAVGATGFATTTGRLTVQAHVMDEVSAPSAMLVNRMYDEFATAASGDEVIDLPTDRVWQALLVRAYKSGTAMNTSLSNLKLDFGGGKYIPFDQSIPKFWRKMVSELGNINSELLARVSNAASFQNWMAFVIGGNVTGRATDNIVTVNSHDNSQTGVYIVNGAGAAQSNKGVWCQLRGTSLENCVVYPFGNLLEPNQWLNPGGMGKAKLKITQNDASATCQVALREVHTY